MVTNDLGRYRICNSCVMELERFLTAEDFDITDSGEVREKIHEFFCSDARESGAVPTRAEMVKELLDRMIDRR